MEEEILEWLAPDGSLTPERARALASVNDAAWDAIVALAAGRSLAQIALVRFRLRQACIYRVGECEPAEYIGPEPCSEEPPPGELPPAPPPRVLPPTPPQPPAPPVTTACPPIVARLKV